LRSDCPCQCGVGEEAALKKYVVHLTPEERESLLSLTRKGKASARRIKRAMVLLAADAGDKDELIAEKVSVHRVTVENIRRRCVEDGVIGALNDRPRPGKARLLDGRQEAYLVALTGSAPPEGRERWTMQLLADKLVELRVVDQISDETVRRVLKKGTQALAASAMVFPDFRC
jgi:transposase